MDVMDLRGLEPPEPFERILAALSKLDEGRVVRAIFPHMPWPLVRVLERDGYLYEAVEREEGDVEMCISRPQNKTDV